MDNVDLWMGIVFPYANFFIFLALAVYFFRGPARRAALDKKAAYERAVTEAKAAHDAALLRLNELSARQTKLDSEIQEIKSATQAAAEAEAAKIVTDATRLAQHLQDEAERIAKAETEKARAALRGEIVEAVRANVIQRIKAEVTTDAHLKLVHKRVEDLKSIRAEG